MFKKNEQRLDRLDKEDKTKDRLKQKAPRQGFGERIDRVRANFPRNK